MFLTHKVASEFGARVRLAVGLEIKNCSFCSLPTLLIDSQLLLCLLALNPFYSYSPTPSFASTTIQDPTAKIAMQDRHGRGGKCQRDEMRDKSRLARKRAHNAEPSGESLNVPTSVC